MKNNEDPIEPEIPEVNPEINERAVRLYGQGDAMEDFPVLKAFQQYVDSEQSKARKRMLMLSIFFGILMSVVVVVFLFLLLRAGAQNQKLNDRLVEYAMQERVRESEKNVAAPVVVQPQQDSAAILALTSKIDDLQKKLAADQAKAEKDAKDAQDRADKAIAEARARADKAAADAAAAEKARLEAVRAAEESARIAKGPSEEELEIRRLKALLEDQKKKQAEMLKREAERKRQEELEAYRRKHYPEYYQKRRTNETKAIEEDDVDSVLNDVEPISYYDEEEEQQPVKPKRKISAPSPSRQKRAVPTEKTKRAESVTTKPDEDEYKIPVDIKGSRLTWQIPEE